MKLLYDRNMLLGETLFPRLGKARPCEGRLLSAADLKGIDLLFVRSTTRLNQALLSGSGVRFVGSGVAGTDHIDFPALRELGIPVATAPGCNAESVADFVIAALLAIGERQGRDWAGATLGIVGVGHVGSIVKRFAEEALGMRTVCCDPPRKDHGDADARTFVSFEDLLPQADVITFHTPLNEDGLYKTRGLFSGPIVRRTKPGAVLLNFARGPVCDNALLSTMLGAGLLSDAAIDCWEGEPDYSAELASLAFLVTPHIAGHAYEGKADGTLAVYKAACGALGVSPGEDPVYPPAPISKLTVDCSGKTDAQILRAVVRTTCDIEGDTVRFRAAYASDEAKRRANFDALRKDYPLRRLFSATRVTLRAPSPVLRSKLEALGFSVAVVKASAPKKSAPQKRTLIVAVRRKTSAGALEKKTSAVKTSSIRKSASNKATPKVVAGKKTFSKASALKASVSKPKRSLVAADKKPSVKKLKSEKPKAKTVTSQKKANLKISVISSRRH